MRGCGPQRANNLPRNLALRAERVITGPCTSRRSSPLLRLRTPPPSLPIERSDDRQGAAADAPTARKRGNRTAHISCGVCHQVLDRARPSRVRLESVRRGAGTGRGESARETQLTRAWKIRPTTTPPSPAPGDAPPRRRARNPFRRLTIPRRRHPAAALSPSSSRVSVSLARGGFLRVTERQREVGRSSKESGDDGRGNGARGVGRRRRGKDGWGRKGKTGHKNCRRRVA